MSKQDKIKWDHVRKWVDRAGLKTTWKPYGMPEVIDPFTSRFADIDPMPKWNISGKVMISTCSRTDSSKSQMPTASTSVRSVVNKHTTTYVNASTSAQYARARAR